MRANAPRHNVFFGVATTCAQSGGQTGGGLLRGRRHVATLGPLVLRVREPEPTAESSTEHALLFVGRWLLAQGYGFTTITPASHARVNARPTAKFARDLRDVFGWSRPFERTLLPKEVFDALVEAGAAVEQNGALRSAVRYSSLGDNLFVHSAYPTTEADAVFFGPDTYRYAQSLSRLPGRFGRAIDIGAGSGAGLLSMADRCENITCADINGRALSFARVNATLCGVRAQVVHSDVLRGVEGDFDLIVSNPPYLVDCKARAYRHGGDRGIELPARIVEEGLGRLRVGGTLCVYTGTPVVGGEDLFRTRTARMLTGFDVRYEALDVDVFGEELDEPAYADVDRIALVSLTATRRST